MNTKTRIELDDTIVDVATKMGEGNPGALRVLADIYKESGAIDPQNALGGFGVILSLDSLGIYGPRIWMLYKDVCHESLLLMLAVLRANGFGYLSAEALNHGIDNRGDGIETGALLAQVQEQLTDFAYPVSSEEIA